LRFGNTCFEGDRRLDLPNALWQDRREMRRPLIRAVLRQEAEPRLAMTENGRNVIYALRTSGVRCVLVVSVLLGSLLASAALAQVAGPTPVLVAQSRQVPPGTRPVIRPPFQPKAVTAPELSMTGERPPSKTVTPPAPSTTGRR
jgi:hypothetical protein